jgi:ClpP class serine protease
MSPRQYLSQIISKVLALDKVRARTFVRSLALALLKSERPEEDYFGGALPTLQIIGDYARIPLWGVIDQAVPDWIKNYGFGITDAADIEEEIARALADQNVRFLVFPTDSPGGSGTAAEKLFDLIEAANRKKPCFGFIGDGAMACSGAYWALAACRVIYAAPYAEAIGNVGAYMVMLDESEFWKQQGFDWLVLRDGEYKAIGEDKPSQEQLDYLQSIVTDCAALFRKNVSKYRTEIKAADMRGQWFKGSDAAARGFVGGNVKDENAAIAKFRKMV